MKFTIEKCESPALNDYSYTSLLITNPVEANNQKDRLLLDFGVKLN